MKYRLVLLLLLAIHSLSAQSAYASDNSASNEKETSFQPQSLWHPFYSVIEKLTGGSFVFARSTHYHKDEAVSDSNTRKKKTASLISIDTVHAYKLGVVAVDPAIIPYGSIIISSSGKTYIAADRGGDVVSRKAARELALLHGYDTSSPEYRALVLDFYSTRQVGDYWEYFFVLKYRGKTPFRDLKNAEKIAYLQSLSGKTPKRSS